MRRLKCSVSNRKKNTADAQFYEFHKELQMLQQQQLQQ